MADEENKGSSPEQGELEAAKAAAEARRAKAQAAMGMDVPPAPGTMRPAETQTPAADTIKVSNPQKALEMAKDKIYVWPYLVRAEFVAAIIVLSILTIWSLVVDAPLEEPANPARTPNPSKAPWYFLGLQEMLVYFDPWLAGVIFPQFIITGLMILPYIDVNPKGNGYYTYKERKFAINTFLFGFLVLWIMLIEVGVFLRGPGWNFFAPWHVWDPHLVKALTNVDLVDLWPFSVVSNVFPFRIPLPELVGGGYLDMIGATVVNGFVVGLPLLGWLVVTNKGEEIVTKIPVVRSIFGPGYRDTVRKMGAVRYWVTAIHFSFMLFLPFKMLLRWFFNLKYLWVTPWFKI